MSYPVITAIQALDASSQTFHIIGPKPESEPGTATQQTIYIPLSVVMPLLPSSETQPLTDKSISGEIPKSEDKSVEGKRLIRPIRPKPETDSRTATPLSISLPRAVVMPLVPAAKTQENSTLPSKKKCNDKVAKCMPAVEDRQVCNVCDKAYKNKKQLSKHKTVVHKIITANNGIKCLEDPCRKSHHYFATLQTFRDHLDSFHHIKDINDKEELTFNNMKDFQDWLQMEEARSQSHFVLPRGAREKLGERILLFTCNRSGSYVPKGTGKRKIKSQGSHKIGFYCTAGMKVTISKTESRIHVIYYKTHYKHEKSLGHLPLSKADREAIAAMLVQGIDADSILYGIRSTAGERIERKHITKRKDLHNIRRAFGIPNPRDVYKIYNANAANTEEWLEEMKKLEDRNPVIFYKPEGEEHYLLNKDDLFLIVISHFQRKMLESFGSDRICIDSIKNIEDYPYEIAVIIIIDEFQEPFPVAFCFCSSINFSSMKLFFQHIQSTVGSIKANTFMSDDSPAFYNAWAETFGPANHRLFSWHVDKQWQDQLQTIQDEDKKEMVGNMLKTLLYELDKNTFHQTLSQFLMELKEDLDTIFFHDYFVHYYCNRIPMWASCYGKEAAIDADVYAEAFHNMLKQACLSGDENKRIEKCVNSLLSHVLDLHFDHESKLNKGKVPFMFSLSPQNNKNLSLCRRNDENIQDQFTDDELGEEDSSCDDYTKFQTLNSTQVLGTSQLENGNQHSYVHLLVTDVEHRKSNKRKLSEQLNVVSELIMNKPDLPDSLSNVVSKYFDAIEHLLRNDKSGIQVPGNELYVNKRVALEN